MRISYDKAYNNKSLFGRVFPGKFHRSISNIPGATAAAHGVMPKLPGFILHALCVVRCTPCTMLSPKPGGRNKYGGFQLKRKPFTYNFPGNETTGQVIKVLDEKTRFMRDKVIMKELEKGDENKVNCIRGFYNAYKTYLIPGCSKEEFADMYAQTLTFGVFTAGLLYGEEFGREKTIRHITRNNPILYDIFDFVSRGPFSRDLQNCIDHITDLVWCCVIPQMVLGQTPEGGGE